MSASSTLGRSLPAASPSRGAALAAALLAEWPRFALWLPVALGAGILLYFAGTTEPDPAWRWLPWPLLAAALLLCRRRPLAGWVCGMAAAGALGFAAASWHAAGQPPPMTPPATAVSVSGVVQAVDLLPEGRRVTLGAVRFAPDGEIQPRQVRVRLRGNDPARPAPGDTLSVRTLLRAPAAPAFPGAWDHQRNAYFSELGASGFALAPASVTPGNGAAPPLAATRALIEGKVTATLPGGTGAIAAALITGSVSAIPPADLVAMRDSGLAHLLSVGGLHIAIVMGAAFGLARLLIALWPGLALRVEGKLWASFAALAAGAFYTLLTGAQVPMLRSFAMAAVVTLGVMLGRRALSLRTLALAAVVILLAQPVALLGPSFQMSFAAVLALIAAWEWARPHLVRLRGTGEWWRHALLFLLGTLLTSIVAGAATTPFGLHHFGRLQWYGIVANALAVPVTSLLVMPAGILAMALLPFGMQDLGLVPMGWGVDFILWTARLVAGWPGAAQLAPPIPGWGLALLSFGLLWLCLWRARFRLLGLPLILAGLFSGLAATPPDLLVSGDARLIALRTPAGVLLERAAGAQNLTRDSWLRAWGEEAAAPLPRSGVAGAIVCTPQACRWHPAATDGAVLLLRPQGRNDRPLLAPEACAGLVLVVSAAPLRGRCAGLPSIDRFSVWRDGPHAVWLGPQGATVLSDRAARGARPWVPPVPLPRPFTGDGPLAPAE